MSILGPYDAPSVILHFTDSCVSLELSAPQEPNGIITEFKVG